MLCFVVGNDVVMIPGFHCLNHSSVYSFFVFLYETKVSQMSITLITGGQRSGKSSYAERMALQLAEHPVYLATARVWDDEFKKRIEHHQASRGSRWINIEEGKALNRHDFTGKVVLVDCVTLWCTNYFFDLNSDTHAALDALQKEFDALISQNATFIFVTNEIGFCGVSENLLQRKFTDLQGWMNQYIAERAERVVLMVSGIPVTIKEKEEERNFDSMDYV